jgi:hypothetical protein
LIFEYVNGKDTVCKTAPQGRAVSGHVRLAAKVAAFADFERRQSIALNLALVRFAAIVDVLATADCANVIVALCVCASPKASSGKTLKFVRFAAELLVASSYTACTDRQWAGIVLAFCDATACSLSRTKVEGSSALTSEYVRLENATCETAPNRAGVFATDSTLAEIRRAAATRR